MRLRSRDEAPTIHMKGSGLLVVPEKLPLAEQICSAAWYSCRRYKIAMTTNSLRTFLGSYAPTLSTGMSVKLSKVKMRHMIFT